MRLSEFYLLGNEISRSYATKLGKNCSKLGEFKSRVRVSPLPFDIWSVESSRNFFPGALNANFTNGLSILAKMLASFVVYNPGNVFITRFVP